MTSNNPYIIDYQQLALGEFELQIHLDAALFAQFPQSEIIDANADATIHLTKHHNFAELDVKITGTASTPCDRCLDLVELPVNWHSNCIIKVTDQDPDSDDPEIIYISPNESSVSLAHYLYESVALSLPVSRTHPKIEQCNQDVVRFISAQQNPDDNQQ